jgi:hypothetical protein
MGTAAFRGKTPAAEDPPGPYCGNPSAQGKWIAYPPVKTPATPLATSW